MLQGSPYHLPDPDKRWLSVYVEVDSFWPYSLHSDTSGPANVLVFKADQSYILELLNSFMWLRENYAY